MRVKGVGIPGVVLAGVIFLAPRAGSAEDFIRGDVNGDGVVSLADAYALAHHLTGAAIDVQACTAAADFDADGCIDWVDVLKTKLFLIGHGGPPQAPFPGPGPDPGLRPLECRTYGGGSPLLDRSALLRIDGLARGKGDRHAIFTVRLSNSLPLGSYLGRVRVPVGLVEDPPEGTISSATELHPTPPDSDRWILGKAQDGRITFAFLHPGVCLVWDEGEVCTAFDPAAQVAPGEEVPVLSFSACLAQGTPAGVYPLVLEEGELAEADSGRAVHPQLIDGSLTVLDDIGGEDCELPSYKPLVVRYALGNAYGRRGAEVTVPLYLSSTYDVEGFAFSLDFDEGVLEGLSVEPRWKRPDGKRWEFQRFEFNNRDLIPGSGGLDEGFVVGVVVFDAVTRVVIPAGEEVHLADLHFRVREGSEAGFTKIRFMDGGVGDSSSVPVANWINVGGPVTPETADAFVLLDGQVSIVGDVSTFIRGDANGDHFVDLGDAQATLNYLFLGGPAPRCGDAADADDSGVLDIADPVLTLAYLFLGSASLPEPLGIPGVDPTPDGLGCETPQ